MSVYASLALVMGIIAGAGGVLFHHRRRDKMILKNAPTTLTNFPPNTLQSEGIDPPKKETEVTEKVVKEASVKKPATSSPAKIKKPKVKKKVIKKKVVKKVVKKKPKKKKK